MFKSIHQFVYQISESDVPGVPPQTVAIQADGELTLPELFEIFEKYIKAVGYFPPENSHLDFVADSPNCKDRCACQEE